ncbi:HpaII family restriction endonuclease [Rufibacter sp. LB8]|uniref:HpaII family restriction endonuclease n=1 Tax=Rufibacter sp. LB8 TaxID=2777781 RepID=UPI00351C8E6D
MVVVSGNEEILRIPISEFKLRAGFLLKKIRNTPGVFPVPEIEQFMKDINCLSLKASSSAKTDITIVVHDQRTGLQPSLGFSIKSQLGNPSTLLNAGETTNFIYKITGAAFSQKEIDDINSISTKSKIKDRISAITSKGGLFSFVKTQRTIFGNNLILIDSLLPQILASVLFHFYTSSHSNTADLVKITETQNPLDFDISDKHLFYSYKIKRFLTDIALGMMPSKVWTGQYDATGGYLIVKADGEIVCYHIYNKNEFEDYLFANTRLDTASSTRHDFGVIYKEAGEYYFKLNLQVRFK